MFRGQRISEVEFSRPTKFRGFNDIFICSAITHRYYQLRMRYNCITLGSQVRTDSVRTDVGDGVHGLHVVHGVHRHLLLLLLFLGNCLLSFDAHLALALGDVRREARHRGGLNTVGKAKADTLAIAILDPCP